jgi:hypothetical protein
MIQDQTDESKTLWVIMTLAHAVRAALLVRLESTSAAPAYRTPNVKVMLTINTPCCGYEVDTTSDVRNKDITPKVSDVAICVSCGAWLVFKEDLTMRLFGPEDLLMTSDEMLLEMRRATALIRQRGRLGPS